MAKNRIFRRRCRRKRKTRRGRRHRKRKTQRRRRRRKRKTHTKRGGGAYKGLRPGDRVQLSPAGIDRVLAGNFPIWSTYRISQPLAPYLQDPGSWRGKVKYARKGGWGTYYAGKIWVRWTFPRNNATNQIIEIQYEDLWQGGQPTNYNLHGGPVSDIERVNDGSEALQPGG